MTDATEIGAARTTRARRASFANVALQAVQVATGLVSVPLTFQYLGPERFGLWMTLSTALAFIAFADFGIGIGMQDRMVKALAADDRNAARSYFFSTMTFVAILVLLMVGLASFAVPSLEVADAFTIKSPEARSEVAATTFMVVVVFGIGLLAGLVQRVFSAFQEAYLAAFILLAARILSLILLVASIRFEAGLPLLVFIIGGLPPAVLVLAGILLLGARHRWMLPRRSSVSELIELRRLVSVFKIGVLGLGAAVAIYVVNNSSLVIMSAKYGAAEVSDYAILVKMLSIPTMFVIYILQPLWPAIADANARRDYRWIQSAYSKAARVSVAFVVATALGVLLCGRQLVELWVGREDVVPSFALMLVSVGFFVVGCWNTLLTTLLNGVSSFRSQATGGTAIAITFAFVAYVLPTSLDKSVVVAAVGFGFIVRCLLLQLEVNRLLRTWVANAA